MKPWHEGKGPAGPAESVEPNTAEITWLGTAGLRLRYLDTLLFIDWHLTRPRPKQLGPDWISEAAAAHGLLVTHGHFDHAMDLPLLAGLSQARILAPEIILRRLLGMGIDGSRLVANERNDFVPIGDVAVRILPSRHIRFDPALIVMTLINTLRNRMLKEVLGLSLAWPLGSNSDFLLGCGPMKIFHAGSLNASVEERRGLCPDLAILPCAGRSNMVEPLQRTIEALCPKKVLLHHHDVFLPGFVLPQPVNLVALSLERRLKGSGLDVDIEAASLGKTLFLEPGEPGRKGPHG